MELLVNIYVIASFFTKLIGNFSVIGSSIIELLAKIKIKPWLVEGILTKKWLKLWGIGWNCCRQLLSSQGLCRNDVASWLLA
jgi:hypothetical protein